MYKKRGLPDDKMMRHSQHFIDTLFSRDDHSFGKMLSIESLLTNSDQPRKILGDLEGLIQSIQNYGVLEPLLVRPIEEGKYQIIAGERRYHAALACGLTHLPCMEILVENEAQSLELALVENLQRQDLDPFEEAQAFRALQEKYKYTQEIIAQRIGKKRSTIAEIMTIADMPDEIKSLCRHADITAKSLLLEIAKGKDLIKMREMIDAIMDGKGREAIRNIRKSNGASQHFSYFELKDDINPIGLKIKYGKSGIDKEKIIDFLKLTIARLERDGIPPEAKRKPIKKSKR